MKYFLWISIFLILFPPFNVEAQSISSAWQKHYEGRYYQAMEEALALNSAEGFALAARSRLILVRFYMEPEERLPNIEIALEETKKSLEIGPQNLEALLQSAVAWGLKARIGKKVKDAKEAKKFIDLALKNAPNNPWAWAAHGGWNAEVIQNAGGLMGRLIFGAKRKNSIESFKKSIELSQNKIPFLLAYGQSLLRYKKDKYHDEVKAVLDEITPLKPQNHLDQISKQFAKAILLALNMGDSKKLEILLGGFAKPPAGE